MTRPHRILIDAHMVGENEAGNETYIVNLIRGLQSLDDDARYIIATAHPAALEQKISLGGRFQPAVVSASPYRRLLIDLPRALRRHQADLLHITYMAPPWPGIPYVASIHDIIFKKHPEWFSRRDRIVLGAGIARSVRRARAILTLSEHSRRDIHAIYGAPLDRIHAIPLAPDAIFSAPPAPADVEQTRRARGLSDPYILAVGSLQPRKNLVRLVRAFASAKKARPTPHKLVLVGKPAWPKSELQTAIRACGMESEIVFTGYVSDAELARLYYGAAFFIYPSLYEGFGLPIVEAMACGIPVIASQTSSMPEITGDAALLIDPRQESDIAAAIDRLRFDETLRRSLAERGRERARHFSWKKTAAATRNVYALAIRGDG
jgi:glycosyltransferase involved in cell wall biosynthesis